jgi:hypothetical protein
LEFVDEVPLTFWIGIVRDTDFSCWTGIATPEEADLELDDVEAAAGAAWKTTKS